MRRNSARDPLIEALRDFVALTERLRGDLTRVTEARTLKEAKLHARVGLRRKLTARPDQTLPGTETPE